MGGTRMRRSGGSNWPWSLLEQVLAQDVEQGDDGKPQLRQGVTRERMPSITDPEMRHGRKSAARKWSGDKQHITTDPETELVTAVTVSPASTGDGAQLTGAPGPAASDWPGSRSGRGRSGVRRWRVAGGFGPTGSRGCGQSRARAQRGVLLERRASPLTLLARTVRCPAGQAALIPDRVRVWAFCSASRFRPRCCRRLPPSRPVCPRARWKKHHDRRVRGAPPARPGAAAATRLIQVLLHRRPLVERKPSSTSIRI